jgi:indolepyruvate ferredoxin oxidoreductase beta subunit
MLPPPGVLIGREKIPDIAALKAAIEDAAGRAWHVPIRAIGVKLGAPQIGNAALLGAACASGLLPFDFTALETSLGKHLPPRQVEVNLQAARLGRDAVQ